MRCGGFARPGASGLRAGRAFRSGGVRRGMVSAAGRKATGKPETVKQRLLVYHEQTKPLIDYYRRENVLCTVDGTQDMEKVFLDITKTLGA